MRLRPECIGDYHGVFVALLRGAPDGFVPMGDEVLDQAQALRDGFDDLRDGFHLVQEKIEDERQRRIVRELIEMSFEAYAAGDAKTGVLVLGEAEGMIWNVRARPVKFAVEAERRAFGAR
jgi:hypothetical protein